MCFIEMTLQITLISRRSKLNAKTKKALPIVRGISNEEKLLGTLASIPDVVVRLVDLSSLSLASQLDLIINTDILVGNALRT